MTASHYMVIASQRGKTNLSKTYCKTAVGFDTDANVADTTLTLAEAQTEYTATAADGSPYSIVSLICVDDNGITSVYSEKRV